MKILESRKIQVGRVLWRTAVLSHPLKAGLAAKLDLTLKLDQVPELHAVEF